LLRGERLPRARASLQPTIPEKSLPYDPAPTVVTSSIAPDAVNERLLSNLYPVLELPEFVYGAKTTIRKKSEINNQPDSKDIAPFILREGKIFSFSPIFGETKASADAPTKFADWFADSDKRRWAVELLNVSFKQFAYHRHLRFDQTHSRYYFLPKKGGYPKRIYWNIGGKWVPREVAARHTIKRPKSDGEVETVQIGWRQQGIYANFVLLPSGLFLRIEPTWLLTKADGKGVRGGRRVGPILSHWLNQERNGQILRSLRFWSLVLSRGKDEIAISTGQQPIRIGLVQDSGYFQFGIIGDQLDFDTLMKTELEDDISMPQLGLFDESNFNSELNEGESTD
jgi:hypothetical protein